jgi:hypothetical protein
MNKAEMNFVNEMTRKLLIGWCHRTLAGLPAVPAIPVGPTLPEPEGNIRIYIEHAQNKKWLNADRTKVLSGGFNTAASFLRR